MGTDLSGRTTLVTGAGLATATRRHWNLGTTAITEETAVAVHELHLNGSQVLIDIQKYVNW